MKKSTRKVLQFVLITYGLSLGLVLVYFGFGGGWSGIGPLFVAIGYMFIPMISTIILQKFVHKEKIIKPLQISFKLNRWFLVAWLLPPVLAFATFGISLLFPDVVYSPDMAGMFEMYGNSLTPDQIEQMKISIANMPLHPIWLGLISGLIAGATVNAVAGFGEELGWRGFLQKELGHLNFWKSSILIGLIWGVWHSPLILLGHNYPQHPVAGVFMMILWTILLAPIFSYVRIKAQSVIAAALMHGSLNGTVGLAVIMVSGGNDLTVGLTGLAGFIALFFLNILLYFYDKKFAKIPISKTLKISGRN